MTVKTHHFGIILTMVSSAITGIQAYAGQTVNLSDPAIWTTLYSVAITIYGLIRNPPQQ